MTSRGLRGVAWLCLLGGLALGCSKNEPEKQEKRVVEEPRRRVPKVHISSRRAMPGATGPDTNQADQAGIELHAKAAKTCAADQKCMLANCGKLCQSWMAKELAGTKLTAHEKNRIYFECSGYCLDPDAKD